MAIIFITKLVPWVSIDGSIKLFSEIITRIKIVVTAGVAAGGQNTM